MFEMAVQRIGLFKELEFDHVSIATVGVEMGGLENQLEGAHKAMYG